MNVSESADGDRYCVLSHGTSWLAIPAASVREVCCLPPLVRIPRATRYLAGLGHLRNEFIPVVRLEPDAVETSEARVIVLNGPQGTWGIVAQSVPPLQTFEVTPTTQATAESFWSVARLGSAMFRGQFVTVVEPNRLYRAVEQFLQQHWQTQPVSPMHVSLPDSIPHRSIGAV